MFRIWLRTDAFLERAEAAGHTTYESQANAAGISYGSLWRARHGQPVGGGTVAALLALYGCGFDDLFSTSAQQGATQHMRDAA